MINHLYPSSTHICKVYTKHLVCQMIQKKQPLCYCEHVYSNKTCQWWRISKPWKTLRMKLWQLLSLYFNRNISMTPEQTVCRWKPLKVLGNKVAGGPWVGIILSNEAVSFLALWFPFGATAYFCFTTDIVLSNPLHLFDSFDYFSDEVDLSGDPFLDPWVGNH